jgi:beta-galactosidase
MKRMIANCLFFLAALTTACFGADAYRAPESPRKEFDINLDWRFSRAAKSDDDLPGFETPSFDDASWQVVSLPHTYNDVDSFRVKISHGGGDRGTFKGLGFYRKRFQLPGKSPGGKVLLELEGLRQAAQVFVNGQEIGWAENGVTPHGLDITALVRWENADNLLSARVDNRGGYAERSSGKNFQWNTNDFNPNHGGLNQKAWLHVTGPIYQTLPLYDNLETTGVYVHADQINVAARSAEITVESQVHNAGDDQATVTLHVDIESADGKLLGHFLAEPLDMVAGEKSVITAAGVVGDLQFWSIEQPAIYRVVTSLRVNDKVVDVQTTRTGFRQTSFRGGVGKGGVFLNDKFVYLQGFAQRSSNEWAGLGQAYPAWMHELQARLIRECHGNCIRWMHVTPQPVDVAACDRSGILQICPAGDKEKDVQGRQWEQRLEAMRAAMIYFRNSPSILFWEAGNNGVSAEHMRQMVELKKEWDPSGGRVMGCRTLQGSAEDSAANTKTAEYFGVMIGQDPRTEKLKGPEEMFRAYSAERRNRAPIIETEDFRDEGARRFWDDASPPYFGFKKGPNDTYGWTSETFALAGVGRFAEYWKNRISNTDPAHSKWSGYASIYFSDSNADGRQQSSETCRVSGKVDAVRLPKQIYFAHRVMQNSQPDLHILGHWSYPADTKKTVYVVANTESVELLLNGKSLGEKREPHDNFTFSFPDITFRPGTLTALGKRHGKVVCQMELKTAGPATALRLTPILSPTGLSADGNDVALLDIEVVDEAGQRCPTDDERVDFTCTGPAIWRGGYNSGKVGSTNNLYVNTECGINRVSLRTTLEAGKISITASREGLKSASVSLESQPVQLVGGLRERRLLTDDH